MAQTRVVKCPYCDQEISLSGIDMHVKMKHPEKYGEFIKGIAEIRAGAHVKETAPEPPSSPGDQKPPEPAREPPKKPPKKPKKPKRESKMATRRKVNFDTSKPPKPPEPDKESEEPQGDSFLGSLKRELDETFDDLFDG